MNMKLEINKKFAGKNKRRESFFSFLLLFFLTFFGCQEPLTPDNDLPPPPAGKGSFSLTLSNSARTILPETPGLNDFAVYNIDFTPVNGGFSENTDRTNQTLAINPILLEPGTYNIVINAYKDNAKSQLTARGTLNGIVIAAGQNTSAAITLEALLSGGTGTFRWEITLPAGVTASMTIMPGNTGGTTQQTVTLTPPKASGSRPLNSGTYNLTFNLTKTDGKTAVWNELLYVYQNLESNFAFTFTDTHFSDSVYNVTYNYNNGVTSNQTQSVLHGGTLISTADPARTNYTFGGWYTDNNTFANQWNFNNPVIESFSLYAKWTLNRYTVTFNANGATGGAVPAAQTVDYNTSTTLPTQGSLVRTYCTFGGWNTNAAGTGTNYNTNSPFTVTENITLYAKWEFAMPIPLTDINHVVPYLAVQTEGTSEDNPVTLPLQIDLGNTATSDSGWRQLLNAIEAANKYVNIDLSICTMSGTEFNPISSISTGKNRIVGIVLPNTAASITTSTYTVAFQNFTVLKSFGGEGLTSIGSSAFRDCTSLTQVTLPAGLTSIRTYAFSGCTSLTQITLPAGLTSIGEYAFSGCTSLTQVTLPAGLYMTYEWTTTNYILNGSVFSNCPALASFTVTGTGRLSAAYNGRALVMNDISYLIAYPSASGSITLPAGLSTIGSSAFEKCTNLTQITLPTGFTSIDNNAFLGCTNLALTSLPTSLTFIGGDAFAGCTNLALTSLPTGVTYIGDYAFSGCTNLALISLPTGVTSIEQRTFSGCTNLALTSLPAGITSIGEGAFLGCTNLALTSLPTGVTSIGNRAFERCTNLALTSLPAGLTSIDDAVFYGCTKLALTSLPAGVTSIGHSAFYGCTKLALTSLPAGVTDMSQDVFNGCTSLTQITLPAGLRMIGWRSFFGCTSLVLVTCLAQTPPMLVSSVFANNHPNLQIKVPAGSVAAYKADSNWSEYASRISGI